MERPRLLKICHDDFGQKWVSPAFVTSVDYRKYDSDGSQSLSVYTVNGMVQLNASDGGDEFGIKQIKSALEALGLS